MAPKIPFKPTPLTLNLRTRSGSQANTDESGDGRPADHANEEPEAPSPPAPHRLLPSWLPPSSQDDAPILYPVPAYTYQLRPRPSRPPSTTNSAVGQSPRLPAHIRTRTQSISTRGSDGERPASHAAPSRPSRADTPMPRVSPRETPSLPPPPLPTAHTTPPAANPPNRPPQQGVRWDYGLYEDASTVNATDSVTEVPSEPPSRSAGQPSVMPPPPRNMPHGPSSRQWRFTMQGDAASTTETETTVRPRPAASHPPAGQPAPPMSVPPQQGHQNDSNTAVGDGSSVRMVSFEEWDQLTRARPAGPWTLDWWPEGLRYTPPEEWGTRHFWSGELHFDWNEPDPDDPWIPCLHCCKAHWFISTQKNPGAKFFKCQFNRHPEDCRMFSYEGPLRADGKIKLTTVVFPPGMEPDRYPPANLIVRPPERVDPRIAYIRDMRNRENQRRYNELQETYRQARLEGERLRAEHAARLASQPASQPTSQPIDPNVGPEHYAPGESPLPVPSVGVPSHVEPASPTPVIAPRAPRAQVYALRRSNTAAFRNQLAEIMGSPGAENTSQDHARPAGQPALRPAESTDEPPPNMSEAGTRKTIDKGKNKAVEKRPAEGQPDDAPPPQRQRVESAGGDPPVTPRGPRSWHGSHTWPIGVAPDPEYVRRDLAALASLPGPQTRLTMLHLAASILADPNVLPESTRAAVEGALNREIDDEGNRLREEESRREYEEWAQRNHRAPPRE
ncbi:hypothetical protein CALCODRAFT_482605 [Calocera cornea HHB12733]|uniref:Uncharacterized protein n=1 Tax=Calocera cornea HHB12733 TaxID=1353952 RepID=A0A165GH36_9BASI|nr:hypothetical protein CALCODRAFT_482605 [Calocera cornea HHB12733]